MFGLRSQHALVVTQPMVGQTTRLKKVYPRFQSSFREHVVGISSEYRKIEKDCLWSSIISKLGSVWKLNTLTIDLVG